MLPALLTMTATLTVTSSAVPYDVVTDDVRRFALVVGNNAALPGSDYEPLRFADDDALRFAALMKRIGAHVELLATVDPETAERFDSDHGARLPLRREVMAAIDRLESRLEAAEGHTREVYVYFSGHGSVGASSSHLHLVDHPFTRTDLYERIIRRLPRERMHVFIDSCHSYFLANSRGRVRARIDDAESIDRYPDVGFVLSTSDRREVHEWHGYRGGVFTYQLLGALSGAADVDDDGVITYPEVHAYVLAANLGVTNPRARVRPFVRRPAGAPALLLSKVARGPRVTVPSSLQGHIRVLDASGFPWLDANKPKGTRLTLLAPSGSVPSLELDGERYPAVATTGDNLRFLDTPVGSVEGLASRGTVEDEFRKNLFKRPFTADFVAGAEAMAQGSVTSLPLERAEPWTNDPLTLGLLGGGTVALATGGVFLGLFLKDRAAANAIPVPNNWDDLRERASLERTISAIGIASGIALVSGGILNAVFGRTEDVSDLTWSAAADERGVGTTVGGRF